MTEEINQTLKTSIISKLDFLDQKELMVIDNIVTAIAMFYSESYMKFYIDSTENKIDSK